MDVATESDDVIEAKFAKEGEQLLIKVLSGLAPS
jgi:hypothetical protein